MYHPNLLNFHLQIAYMFIRTDDILEIAQAFHPIIAMLCRVLQLLVLSIHRNDIKNLLAKLQQFVNLSNITFPF